MAASDLDNDRQPRRARLARRSQLLALAAIGLAACGGTSKSKTVSTADPPAPTQSSSATTAPPATTVNKPRTTTKTATKTASRTTSVARTSTVPLWTTTVKDNSHTATVPASSAAPRYVGPSPIGCLQAAGLNGARPAPEPGVWEANFGVSAASNRNAIVFLSGPYRDAGVANRYAHSLLVVELAASAGRWVASASQPSHLGAAVNRVAACMASGHP